MNVGISRILFPVTTLGPGRRIGLWFQGCSIRCRGCISVDTWAPATTTAPVETILDALDTWADDADGLTVSGGEPLEQLQALEAILRWWRTRSSTSVLLFTGLEYSHIGGELQSLDGLVDAVVTGPFQLRTAQTLTLRGSDNQEIHVLTPLGRQFGSFDRPRTPDDRRLDVSLLPNGEMWFAGIPDRDMFRRLRRGLAASGHSAATSDLRRSRSTT